MDEYNNGKIEPKWFTGSFVFLKNEKVGKIDFFDENIFLYFEELILAEKLNINSFTLKYVSTVNVLHEHNYSEEFINFKKEYEGLKSIIYYYKVYKNYNLFILNAAKISRLFFLVVYKPVVKVTKIIFKKFNISYKRT